MRLHSPVVLRAGIRAVALCAALSLAARAHGQSLVAEAELPDAPSPQLAQQAAAQNASPAGAQLQMPSPAPCIAASTAKPRNLSCFTPADKKEALSRFQNSTRPLPLTPKGKLELAGRNVIDPFNLLTIASLAAIDVASDPDGPYGPGLKGFAKETGTVFTQDMNGEFWGTFVMASVFHQDPHYHRMPGAPIPRRILHCITAVVIAQSDAGKPMFNIVEVGGYTISGSINNLYVPYGRTNVASTAARISTAIALDPIGNAIAEFLPDVAKKINFRTVFLQSIINRVVAEESPGASMSPEAAHSTIKPSPQK